MWRVERAFSNANISRKDNHVYLKLTLRPCCNEKYIKEHLSLYTHTQLFYGHFPGTPEWAGARRELLDFIMQGKINRGRHTDHPARRHSIWTNQFPPPASPHFFHFLQAGCPSCRRTSSVKALKATSLYTALDNSPPRAGNNTKQLIQTNVVTNVSFFKRYIINVQVNMMFQIHQFPFWLLQSPFSVVLHLQYTTHTCLLYTSDAADE